MAVACVVALAVLGLSCGDPHVQSGPAPEIGVSNSWLECCLRDIGGCDLPLARICPPGSCPGHFDIRPGAVAQLRKCRWIFLFDFQQSMEEKLKAISSDGVTTIAIPAPQGLSIPSSYLAGCEAAHVALCEAYPEQKSRFDEALEQVRRRLADLEADLRDQIQAAGLEGARVVASGHQAAFCRWLGLETVAQYSGPETASPARIEALLARGKEAGVRFVIANLQESAQAGEAIAQQLEVPVVIFSNFPSMQDDQQAFDALARANVASLIEAVTATP